MVGGMSDYVIWVTEKLEKEHPDVSWEDLTEDLENYILKHPEMHLSVDDYLKEEKHDKRTDT